MPQINVNGSAPGKGSGQFGTKDQRYEAAYINRGMDDAAKQLRQTAEYMNRDFNASVNNLRKTAEYMNRDFDAAIRHLRQTADYMNKDFDAVINRQKKQADAEYKRDYALANYENRQKDAAAKRQKKQSDDEFKKHYTLANYENKNRDSAYKRDRSLAEYIERNKEASYRKMRAEANRENQEFNARRAYQRAEAERENREYDKRKRREEYLANKPGFLTSAILGGSELLGGNRLRNSVQRVFFGGNRRGGSGRSGGGGGGVGVDDELAAFATVAGVGAGVGLAYEGMKAVYGLAKMVATAPQEISSFANGLVSAAAPYNNLVLGSAGLGRRGGFAGSELMGDLYNADGRMPAWMAKRGITQMGGIATLNAYGSPLTSAGEGKHLLSDIYDASLQTGVDPNAAAQSLGLMQQLGLRSVGGTGTLGGPGGSSATFGVSGAYPYAFDDKYWQKYKSVSAAATAIGLDNSAVFTGINRVLTSAASAGGAGLNYNSASDFYMKLASSGAAGGRTGDLQASFQQNWTQAAGSAGYGGNQPLNNAIFNHFAATGGVPKSRGELEKFLGVDYDKLSPAEQNQFNQALSSKNLGDFGTNVSPFLTAHPEIGSRLADEQLKSWGISPNDPHYNMLKNNIMGQPIGSMAAAADNAGRVTTVQRTSQLDSAYKFLQDQGRTPGEIEGILGGLQQETRFFQNDRNGNPDTSNQVNKDGGGMGAHGIGQLRGDRLTRYMATHGGKLPEQTSMEEQLAFLNQEWTGSEANSHAIVSDPNATPYARGAAFMHDFQRSGDADVIGQRNAGAYASAIHNLYSAGPLNDTTDVNKQATFASTAGVTAGKQASNIATNLIDSGGANTLLAFGAEVGNATIEMTKFVGELIAATNKMHDLNAQNPRGAAGSRVNPAFDQYTVQVP